MSDGRTADQVGRALGMIAAAARLQFRLTIASPLVLVGWVVTPSMLMTVLTLARSEPPTGEEASRVVSGVLLAAFWASLVWSGAATLRRDRQMGTLVHTVASVHSVVTVFLGRVLGASLSTITGTTLAVIAAAFALGLSPRWDNVAATLLGLLLVVATGAGASLLVGSLLLVSRHGDHLANAVGIPVTLLGGTVIPRELLPELLAPVTSLVSLSWLQDWMLGSAVNELAWWSLVWAGVLTVLYFALGALLMSRSLAKARRAANLDLY